MPNPVEFDVSKQPGEEVTSQHDFADKLAVGETLTGAPAVTIKERVSGNDTTAAMLVAGSAATSGSVVSFRRKAGSHNLDYVATIIVSTTKPQTLHAEVIFPVRERPY